MASIDVPERTFVARDRDDGVVVLVVRGPGLVPLGAIDVSAADRALDKGRASLWILAQTVEREPGIYGTYPYDLRDGTTDNRGERPPVEDADALGHHLLVFDGEVGARVRAAVEAGTLELAAPGAYVTRTPVSLAEAQQWASDGVLVAAFPARGPDLDTVWYQGEAPLDFVRMSAARRATPLSAYPEEWKAALGASPALLQSLGAERIALEEICTHVHAVNAATDDEAQRLVALFEADRTPHERSVDPWPTGIVEARGFNLPDRGAGRTVRLTRPLVIGDVVTLLITLGLLIVLAHVVHRGVGRPLGDVGFGVLAGGLALVALLRWHSPWRVQIGQHDAIIWRWTSRRDCSLADAMRDLQGTCAGLFVPRLAASRAGLAPAVVAVHEWLRFTRAGQRFDPDDGAPMSLFAVDEHGVRPLEREVWHTEPGWQTARGTETVWTPRVDELRRAAPNASIVAVPRQDDPRAGTHHLIDAATLLASSADTATMIRRTVRRLRGRSA